MRPRCDSGRVRRRMKWLERWSPLLTGVAGGLVCLPILSNGLTNWDDSHYLTENPFLTAGLWGVARAFAEPFDHAWYPVTQAMLVLVHLVVGGAPLTLHLVQLLLFAGACALLPRALATFDVPMPLGVATTLVWLAHPFRVESTAWVANLKDATSLFFVVLAFALYGAGRRRGSSVAFLIGILSKSMVASLGLLFVGLEARSKREGALTRSAGWWVPSAAVSVIAAVLHLLGRDPWQVPPANFATRLWMPVWYLLRLLWPDSPRAIYAWTALGWDDPRAWVGLLLCGGAVAWAARSPGASRWLLAGFVLPLVSVLGLVPMGQPVAERYTLLASIPLALVVCWAVLKLPRPAALVALLVLVCAETVATVRRAQQWHDGVSLWTANLPLAPSDFTVRYNLAGALGGAGRFREAHQHLLAAYALRPGWPGLDCLLATAQAAAENLDSTWITQSLPKICAAPPDERWLATRQLIAARDRRGEILIEQLSMGPHASEAAALLGALSLQKGDARRALGLARRARVIDPKNEGALMTEASALLSEHRTQEAISVTENPVTDPSIRAALKGIRAAALFEQGKTEEASRLLEESKEELRAAGRPVP